MASLKNNFPGVISAFKVAPSEIDEDQYYYILHPGVLSDTVGTAAPSVNSGTFIITNPRITYPRNLLLSAAGAGDYGGTAVVTGVNQFGEAVTDTIVIGSAAAGGTTNGDQVFGSVTSANWYVNGTGNGTPKLGFSIGTSSAGTPMFGLPTKIASQSDIKQVAWIDDNVEKSTTGTVNLSQHAVYIEVAGGLVNADSFVIKYRSSYDPSSEGLMAKL